MIIIVVYEPCRSVIDLLDSPVCSIADGDPVCHVFTSDDESKYTPNTASTIIGTFVVLSCNPLSAVAMYNHFVRIVP